MSDTRIVLNGGQPFTNPGASSSVVIYDDGFDPGTAPPDAGHGLAKHLKIHVSAYMNQGANIVHKWYPAKMIASASLIQIATYAITASTFLEKEIRLQAGRNKISIDTTTAPGTFLVSAEARDDATVGTTT